MRKDGLDAIVDEDTRVLILGSLPGDESIRRQQYYAKPSNDFWRLISAAVGEDVTTLCYEDKVQKLRQYGIGLWDVLKSSKREGSSDSRIRDEEPNDFSDLMEQAPNLRLICFNGKKAGQYESLFKHIGIETLVLPSSSGANRRYSETRLSEWKSILS